MLNSTKLFYPPITDDYVPRARLQERLKLVARRPLTLVSAPAGYGKTTAVSAWLENSNLVRAWLSLDESDNDPNTFLTYLVAAIRCQLNDFGNELLEIVDRGVPLTAKAFVQQLAQQLDHINRDVALVLDEFQTIRDGDALAVVSELMRHPHPRLHLVLVSRHDPQLPLSEWRARNQMVDIRSGDLRFNLEETTAFLNGATNRPLDSTAIAQLHVSTEGWAAGLRLAALTLSHVQDETSDHILDLNGSNQHTLEFLAEQVMAALPTNWQDFLVRTSILDRLCGPLCEAVIDEAATPQLDGQTLLRELYRENMFIIPLDSQQQWFRYHYLFSEFLRSRLAREYSPEEIAELHLRAGRWFGSAGYVEEAIRHALAAGATHEAVLHFGANRQQLFNEERFGRLLALNRLFPEHVIRSSPNMLLMEAWFAFSMRFDTVTMIKLAHEVDALLDQLDIDPERIRLLRAESDTAKGMAAYFNLEPDAALIYSHNTLQVLPQSYYTMRSFGRLCGAGAMQMQGKLSNALEYLRSGIADDLALPDTPRGRNLGSYAYLYWMSGDLGGMEKVGEHLLTLASLDAYSITGIWSHYFLASIHYHRNDLVKARYHAEMAFEGRSFNPAFVAVYAGLVLATCHQAPGDTERADKVMAHVRAAAVALQSEPLMAVAQAFGIELDLAQGRLAHAVTWAEQQLPVMRLAPLPFFYAPQLTPAKALLAANDPAKATLLGDYLSKWRVHLEAIHNVRFLIEVLAMEALHYDALGDEPAAAAALSRSLALAEPSGFIRVYIDLGLRMKALLRRLRSRNSQSAYIQQILAAFPGASPIANEAMVEPLTERELQVLELLARRLSNKEIAQHLVIAPVTVKRHTINIYQKLNVESRREAVQAAERLGIIEKTQVF